MFKFIFSQSTVVLLKLRMGQVKNGRLYIRYRSSSQKNKAKELKSLHTTSLGCSNAKSTVKVSLTFNRLRKPNLKILILFIFFLLSF